MATDNGDNDDPFASTEHTIIRPRPGGRSSLDDTQAHTTIQPRPVSAGRRATGATAEPLPFVRVPGASPLLDAAAPLLALGMQMRRTVAHEDPDSLLAHVADEVRRFEAAARDGGISPEDVTVVRYCLCTFLDEAALSTPWGAEGTWSRQTLLSTFHNEGWGGEKFFDILARLMEQPTGRLDQLELLYVCLLLDFEGKYRVANRGDAQLVELRDEVGRVLQRQRARPEPDLSPHWRGETEIGVPLAQYVPAWVVIAGAGLSLLLLFLFFSLSLSGESDSAYAELRTLGREIEPPVRTAATTTEQWTPPPPALLNVAGFLEPEIAEGLVQVVDEPGQTKITILGGGLFASGSALLAQERVPLMERIAVALDEVPGRVLITGHTDSDPLPAGLRLKFASNWELSQQRADAVATIVKERVEQPQRVRVEGLADTEPLVPNTSRENKSKNRRVEVLLLPQPGGA